MSDRELLALAAKAAGVCPHLVMEKITPGKGDPVLERWGSIPRCRDCKEDHASWNPLTDDGDALRLAVKLGLQIECRCRDRDFVAVRTPDLNWREYREDTLAEHVPVATRRCIVRAAAEIGKQMP
jgi:hypothetical protein